MRRVGVVVFSLGLSALALAGHPDAVHGVVVAEAQAEAESAAECVGFSKTDVDKGFEYSVSNACSKKLACTVSWTVSCEDNDRKVTSKKHEKAQLALSADGSAAVTASASSCKQGWSIDDVGWSCHEAK